MVQRHTPKECLSRPHIESLPTKCQQLSKGYKDCRCAPILPYLTLALP